MTLRNLAGRLDNRNEFHWNILFYYLVVDYDNKYVDFKSSGANNGEDVLTKTPDEMLDMGEIKVFKISNGAIFVTIESFELVELDKKKVGE